MEDDMPFPVLLGIFSSYEKAKEALSNNQFEKGSNYMVDGPFRILPIKIDKLVDMIDCIDLQHNGDHFEFDEIKWRQNLKN